MKEIIIENININITKKRIKHLYVRVIPPSGEVKASVPKSISEEKLRSFLIERIDWIKETVEKVKSQNKYQEKYYISGEIHHIKGKKYILNLINANKPKIELKEDNIIDFYVPESYTKENRENYYLKWLKKYFERELNVLFIKWENIINVRVSKITIRRMKSKWGSCNTKDKIICLNLELVKTPNYCIEYVVVHELVHFLEKNHNQRFKDFMTYFLPEWKNYKKELNKFQL